MIPNNFTQGHLLKIEWLVLNVTLVGSPDRAECDMFEDDFGHFLPVQAAIVVWDHFVICPVPWQSGIFFGMILDNVWSIQATFLWPRSHFVI